VKNSFGEGVQTLHDWLGVNLDVRCAESTNRRMSQHAESYRRSQPPPPAEEEGEVIVVAGDGKGVPMRRSLAERIGHSKRRGKGEKKNKKQMSYVGAVSTIDRFHRTPGDGKTRLFAQLGVEAKSRDAGSDKPIVCLMDGERALWEAMRRSLPQRTVGILDLYHTRSSSDGECSGTGANRPARARCPRRSTTSR
jgi:hypothetical protein